MPLVSFLNNYGLLPLQIAAALSLSSAVANCDDDDDDDVAEMKSY